MNTRFLATFCAVAETGSIAAAARRLRITSAAAGEQIQTLEKTLGAHLVTRQGRNVVLTASGHAVLLAAWDILARIDNLQQLAQVGKLRGLLRVGSISTALITIVPPALQAIATRYPEIDSKFLQVSPIIFTNCWRRRRSIARSLSSRSSGFQSGWCGSDPRPAARAGSPAGSTRGQHRRPADGGPFHPAGPQGMERPYHHHFPAGPSSPAYRTFRTGCPADDHHPRFTRFGRGVAAGLGNSPASRSGNPQNPCRRSKIRSFPGAARAQRPSGRIDQGIRRGTSRSGNQE